MSEHLSPRERIDLGPDGADGFAIDELTIRIRERLLQEPYFEAETVRELLGVEVLEPLVQDGTLLAYEDHGNHLFPVFQFDPETHRPLEAVSKVNLILDAPSDGWGVTAWWVLENGWLSKGLAPKDLLGTPSEYAAVQLAEAIVQDDSY